jgi:hypothetical protein
MTVVIIEPPEIELEIIEDKQHLQHSKSTFKKWQ